MRHITTIIITLFIGITGRAQQITFTQTVRSAWEDEFHQTFPQSTVGFEADTLIILLSIDDLAKVTGGPYELLDKWIQKDPIHFTRVFLNQIATKTNDLGEVLSITHIKLNFINKKLETYEGIERTI